MVFPRSRKAPLNGLPEARAAFAINYDGNPGQDGRPAKGRHHRTSFDDLVGGGEQRRWYVEAERLGGLEIDVQLEFGGLYDR
jgi:hypothetical protein